MKPNYFQYFISETGQISLNGKPHPTRKNKRGDVTACLNIKGSGAYIRDSKTVRVAQLVCDIYMEREENEKAIVFKDGNKSNIHPDNMIPCTATYAGQYNAKPKDKPKEVDIDINRIAWR